MATGLLPILLGEATKLTAHLQGQDKEYVATIRLGIATDTLDVTGAVTESGRSRRSTAGDVEPVLARFVGDIEQVPPMYSALHAGGRRLHELARAGIAVERPPRRVRVHAFELIEYVAAPPPASASGAGRARTSAASPPTSARRSDAGATSRRSSGRASGPSALEDAVPWAAIQAGDATALAAGVLPADRAVGHLPAVHVSDASPAAPRPRPARAAVASSRRRRSRRPASHAACTPARASSGSARCRPTGLRPLRLLHADRPRPRSVPP